MAKLGKKKWFQVTCPTNPASFRHARSKLCNPDKRALWPVYSSLRDFARNGSLSPDRASRLTPDRNPLLGTAFHSLEKTARFRATFPRSKLLAYPFGSKLKLPRTRSIAPLLHAFQLAPKSANSLRATRCPVPSQLPRPFFNSSLPLRAVSNPSRSKRQADYQPRGSPNRHARSPSLPAASLFSIVEQRINVPDSLRSVRLTV